MTHVSGAENAQTHAGARDDDAWSLFWADAAQSRCVSGSPAIWRALATHWTAFARELPRDARVLDLGCGAGAVGALLLAERADLRVTGIDAAQVPRSKLPRMQLLSRTDMQSLPFEDGSFDAVVSQFGFEYSDTAESAREVARVLAPGAELSFVVHHAQSAIVRTNCEHRGAVVAFFAPTMRDSFCAGDAPGFGAQIALLVQRYPDDALLMQLARALPARLGWLAERRADTWQSLEEAVAPEMLMSDALAASCVAPADIDRWLEPLRAVGDLRPVSVLRDADDTPIAWCVAGTSSG